MTNCEECQRLMREVEILRRIDYRSCRDKALELHEHQMSVHFLHVATTSEKVKR